MSKTYKLSASEKKSLLSVLKKLVAAQTVNPMDNSSNGVNPSGHEDRVVNIVAECLNNLGVKYRVYRKVKGRGNIVWSLGAKNKQETLIAAHSDVVPTGTGWKTDPFKLIRKGGKLYGRGVVDNKSPLAAMLLATKILKKREGELDSKITFAAVADEEQGNVFGMDYLLEKKVFQNVSAAIIPDSCGNNRFVEIAEKGVLHLRVTAFGQQGHGSMPHKSKNAIFILKDFLRQVRQLRFHKKTKLLTPATISVGSFHAGEAVNVIPAEAEATLDIRFPPNENKREIIRQIKKLAEVEAKTWKVQNFRFEIMADLPPSETGERAEIVQQTLAAIKKVTKKKPQLIGMPAFTFGGVLRSRGIPVVGFGPGDLEECHRSNENIAEKEVYEFCEILVELLRS